MAKLSARSLELLRLNAVLLALVIIAILVLPAIRGQFAHYLFPPVFSAIFLVAAFSFKGKRKPVLIVAVVISIVFLLATFFDLALLKIIVQFFQIVFFGFLVASLIKDISSQTNVTRVVILDAITGYLLLGFALSLFVAVVATLIPNAYLVDETIRKTGFDKMSESIYYTFITFSTTGYGEVVPLHPVAKSLAILIGISGQLYIAIIIAMLVGKFSSIKN